MVANAGNVGIWYSIEQDQRVHWNYAYSITRTDKACLQAGKPRSQCVRKLVVT